MLTSFVLNFLDFIKFHKIVVGFFPVFSFGCTLYLLIYNIIINITYKLIFHSMLLLLKNSYLLNFKILVAGLPW